MSQNIGFHRLGYLVSIEAETKELNKTESYKNIFVHELINVLAEAPLSLVFYTNRFEYTQKIQLTTATGTVFKDIRFNDLESIRKYLVQERSGAIVYAASAPERFMGCSLPEANELKSIIDEFDLCEGLYILRGGLLSCILVPVSLSDLMLVYNDYGADYLKSNENVFIMSSLAAILFYLGTKNKLLYIFSDSNALASFLSITVRYYANQNEQLNMSDIPNMMILTIPLVVGSSYAGIKYNNYMLKTIILLTPVIIDHVFSWCVSLNSV